MAAAAAPAAQGQEDKALFNFGATSDDEATVCGSARPGAPQQRCYAEDLRIPEAEVQEWVDFMKQAGIQSVVSMLTPSELKTYAASLPAAMEAAFGASNYVNVEPQAEGAAAQIMGAVQAAHAAGKKVLVHCWGGGGRTGRVLAAWLAASRGITPQEAAEVVLSYADSHGLSRRVDVEALQDFLKEVQSAANTA